MYGKYAFYLFLTAALCFTQAVYSADGLNQGSPKNVLECVQMLKSSLPKNDLDVLRSGTSAEVQRAEFALGLQIRNTLIRPKDSQLRQYFLNLGINNPDDMSEIIIASLSRNLHSKPIQLEEQITNFQKQEEGAFRALISHTTLKKALPERIWSQLVTPRNGEAWKLANAKGKALVICIASSGDYKLVDSLNSLTNKFKKSGFQAIMFLTYTKDTQADQFINRCHPLFSVVSDSSAFLSELHKDIIPPGGLMPVTIVVDKSGIVISKISGWNDKNFQLLEADLAKVTN